MSFRQLSEPVPRFSFVVPVFNEQDALGLFFAALDPVLESINGLTEVILVDDGSRDESVAIIRQKVESDDRYRFIGLSRNFGQQVAITAGLDHARGSAIVIMDADLQDPPDIVPEMIAFWRQGYDVVNGQRRARDGESQFKTKSASWFYRLLNALAPFAIPDGVGDFRLIDRSVANAIRDMRERDRFLRGMFAWVGYRQTNVTFDRPARSAGKTKYSLAKMIRLAANGLLGFSDAPLRFVVWCGIFVSLCAMAYGFYVIVMKFERADLVPGWSSTMVVTAFLAGMNMLMTGIVGLYVGRIHNQVKMRPLYIVHEARGIPALADFDRSPEPEVWTEVA
ncbi:MAG: glycosyltransferase family 2 protein [Alphaproteobacteria bacterium]|nr:glycosyltransferase family 2 protein [Alphaproteobacteria bacterium]